MIERIILFLSFPIMLLNFTSGIVGGIWLAFLGEWKLLGIGFLLMFSAHWGISFLLLPGLAIGGIAVACLHKNYIFGMKCFSFLSQLYTNILIVASCAFAFYICTKQHQSSDFALIPYLLWSWGMALGPWQYLASKELDNEFSGITIMIASILYMFFLIALFIGPTVSVLTLLASLFVQLLALPIFNVYVGSRILQSERV